MARLSYKSTPDRDGKTREDREYDRERANKGGGGEGEHKPEKKGDEGGPAKVEKRGKEGSAEEERTESKAEAKREGDKPRDEGDILERHRTERKALHAKHQGERRELHGNHKHEREQMHQRHEQDHKEMDTRHLAELAGEGNGMQAAMPKGPQAGEAPLGPEAS